MAEINPAVVLPSVKPETAAPDQMLQVQPLAAEGMQKVGQATLGVGKFFGQLQTTDVLNQANSQAQEVMNNYMRLQGQDALNAAPQVQQQIKGIYDQARGNLGSLDQMDQFDQAAGDYQTRYFGRMIAEKGQEAQLQYARSTIQASADNADKQASTAATAPNPATQDQLFQDSLANGRQAAVRSVQIEGNDNDPAIVSDAVAQSDSRITATYIQSQVARDPNSGMAAFTKYGNNLTPEAYQQMRAYVRRSVMPMQIETMAKQTIASGGTPVSELSDQQAQEQWQVESGGSQFGPDGKPLVSSKGAVGIAQLLTSTAQQVAQQNGIAWNQNEFENDPTYNANLGRLYMNGLLKQYNGNYPVALAAYNAGPNNPGVLHFQQTGDPTQLPLETQNYINEVTGGGDMQAQIAQVQAAAAKAFPDDPQEAEEMAYSAVFRLNYQHQAVIRNQLQAQKQQSETFASNIANSIWQAQDKGQPISPDLVTQIDNAPIDMATKDALRKIAMSATGQSQTVGYGSGYTAAFNSILAPYGAPGKITDASQILQLEASGQITSSGAKDLIGTLHDAASTTGAGIATAKVGLLNYARSKLSFQDDTGPIQIKDPEGQALYNTKFIPMFEASYGAWMKAGKDPMQYPVDQIDKMVTALRPPGQMAAAEIAALGDSDMPGNAAPGAPPAPTPAPPATVKDPARWNGYMAQPPQTQNGPIPAARWGEAITLLMADPKQNIPLFDKVFGAYGYDGAEIVAQLSNAPNAGGTNGVAQVLP
jgi:Transglycosylase SLT domain